MVRAALAWHREHPDSQPKVAYAKAGALSPCELPMYGMTAVLVGEQDFDGGSVGDVRIEFEIASRPDLDAGEIRAEVDGEEVSLELDGVDSDRGTRHGRIVLGGEWADGHTADRRAEPSEHRAARRCGTAAPRRDAEHLRGGAARPSSTTTT